MKPLILILDLIFLNLLFVISFYIRHTSFDTFFNHEIRTIWWISNICWIVLVPIFKAYHFIRIDHVELLLRKLIQMIFVHLAVIALTILILKYGQISRLWMLYFYILFTTLLVLLRVAFLKYVKQIRKKGYNSRSVLIVGANYNGKLIADRLTSDLTYGYKLHGYFDENNHVNVVNYLGKIEAMETYLASKKIDEVYIATDQEISSKIDYVIELCERFMIRLKFVPAFFNHTKSRRVSIDYYGNIPVMMFREEPLTNPFNRLVKKGFDLVFSLIVILGIFTWLFPILILFVKLSSKGPIFFKQIRSGENNNEFICYKFRTMKVNSVSDEIQASKNDTRITKIGAFMRKTNLDELPQFFNVLIGNMSVVGPRPHMIKHTLEYSELINNYLIRHFAKPGITGWAQVNGYRGETKELDDMQKRVDFDIWYIENWSFLLDLKIIWRTIVNMIQGDKNAY
jgi:putative colanic acid biosynthesis UDP-glucose lipid carrier transferase